MHTLHRLGARILALAALVLATAIAPALAQENVPQGLLPDVAQPKAYRLEVVILPAQARFAGRAEIDIDLKEPASSLYLHGRELDVSLAQAQVGKQTVGATYKQVDPLGVARVDFAKPLPKGRATLVFEYGAPFGQGASGLFHVEVGKAWYAWTQFESIDARAAYPGFDQPGYKTPFTVSVLTAPGEVAYSNARQIKATTVAAGPASAIGKLAKAAGVKVPEKLTRHTFEATRPLPTYLVAFGAGPFAVAKGQAGPTPQRAKPLAVRVIGTQPNKDAMDFAVQNTGPIVQLLEKYFGRPFPFPKLDQIGTPIMPGAMENAGADTYGDDILFLGKHAPTAQKQEFGMVVAHELAHQWFGDLVTPKWWDDIWLNESFANWMGYRIGNEWRPDLKIGVGAIAEALGAMNIDALKAGRPIHQRIATNAEIDSAFDAVTYGKGGQVVAMIAAFLGDEKFKAGVRLHLNRHAYGNASTEDFFTSLAEAAREPRVVQAMKSFVDQQGVPVVRVERTSTGLTVSQKRYALMGSDLAPQSWIIPLCIRVGKDRKCQLLDKPSDTVALTGPGAIVPNADGAGYYRFSLPEAEWRTLIAAFPTLPPGEALAASDSLGAAFRAGEIAPSLLVEGVRAMAANPYSGAVTSGGLRLAGFRSRGFIPDSALPAYRRLIDDVYGPLLKKLGFDPKAGRYADEDPDQQKLRSELVGLLAAEAQDKNVLSTLDAAVRAFLAGDETALDPSLLDAGFGAHVAIGGEAAAKELFAKASSSNDRLIRNAALAAVGGSGDPPIAKWIIDQMTGKSIRPSDKLTVIRAMVFEPPTRDLAFAWLLANYDVLVKDNGIFVASGLPALGGAFCSVDGANRVESELRPRVDLYKRGALELDRAVEQAHACGVLLEKRGAELAAAL